MNAAHTHTHTHTPTHTNNGLNSSSQSTVTLFVKATLDIGRTAHTKQHYRSLKLKLK